MEPLVSILIPVYNAAEWLADTINSALAQSCARKEIIIVDDGSKDESLSVARRFASRNVKVLSQQNQGAAASRNAAFAQCQGDYIQWLDADDLLAPNKVASQIGMARHIGDVRRLISGPWGSFRYRSEKAVFSSNPLFADRTPVEWLILKMGQNLHMQTATWLVSRQLTEAAGPWNTQMIGDDDGEYFCRVLLASTGVRFVPDACVFYRITGASRLSHIGFSNRKMDAHFLSMQMHIRYLRSLEDSERVNSACVQYLQNWLIHFYPERADIVRQATELAEGMGGKLNNPQLRWKYSWIEKFFGWELAKRAQVTVPHAKATLFNKWDKALYRIGFVLVLVVLQ
jgi:glycosyltransferase involved in cell wall biosynthesis